MKMNEWVAASFPHRGNARHTGLAALHSSVHKWPAGIELAVHLSDSLSAAMNLKLIRVFL